MRTVDIMDRSFVAENARELNRLKQLIGRLTDDNLEAMLNEYWSVAGTLAHVAFYDGRAMFMAGKLIRGEPFTEFDIEPEDVDWINDSMRPLLHAIPPRQAAELALAIARETDELIASLSPEQVAKLDDDSPLNPFRSYHRSEHVDEIEEFLRTNG
jgi:hypothetical protein